MSSCESTKCFSALWTNSVCEDTKYGGQTIRISNDIVVNFEEFHTLLLEKLNFITDNAFVEGERGKTSY